MNKLFAALCFIGLISCIYLARYATVKQPVWPGLPNFCVALISGMACVAGTIYFLNAK